MSKILRFSLASVCLLAVALPIQADDLAQPLNGHWVVTDLVEDGKVVPKAAIPDWLPSGGRMDIEDGAILFKSHVDNKQHARLFSIDGTRIPNVITLTSSDQSQIVGITKTEGQKLVVCLSGPGVTTPPTDFSAEPGSKRMLMVLQRVPPAEKTAQAPQAAPAPAPVATVVTDPEIKRMLVGSWAFDDQFGSVVTFQADGTYQTTRNVEKMRLFKLVFVESPLSSGTWNVEQSHLLYHVLAATDPNRLGQTYTFTVRSISATDFIFVDYFGNVGRATRLP